MNRYNNAFAIIYIFYRSRYIRHLPFPSLHILWFRSFRLDFYSLKSLHLFSRLEPEFDSQEAGRDTLEYWNAILSASFRRPPIAPPSAVGRGDIAHSQKYHRPSIRRALVITRFATPPHCSQSGRRSYITEHTLITFIALPLNYGAFRRATSLYRCC